MKISTTAPAVPVWAVYQTWNGQIELRPVALWVTTLGEDDDDPNVEAYVVSGTRIVPTHEDLLGFTYDKDEDLEGFREDSRDRYIDRFEDALGARAHDRYDKTLGKETCDKILEDFADNEARDTWRDGAIAWLKDGARGQCPEYPRGLVQMFRDAEAVPGFLGEDGALAQNGATK